MNEDPRDNWSHPGPNQEQRMESWSLLPAAKTGSGPNSAAITELRIILGPSTWPNAPPATPAKGAAAAAVAAAYQPPAPGAGAAMSMFPRTLRGTDNRLRLLVSAINGGQQDPYRHDPSTLSLVREALLETNRFMHANAPFTELLQQPIIQTMGERYLRKDYQAVLQAREEFLKLLVGYRNNLPRGQFPKDWPNQVTQFDVLAFLLELQFVVVNHLLKQDMKAVFQRKGEACGPVDHLLFYEFEPSPDARRAFKDYVAIKWPLHVYSIDPVVDQQNVLDAFS